MTPTKLNMNQIPDALRETLRSHEDRIRDLEKRITELEQKIVDFKKK